MIATVVHRWDKLTHLLSAPTDNLDTPVSFSHLDCVRKSMNSPWKVAWNLKYNGRKTVSSFKKKPWLKFQLILKPARRSRWSVERNARVHWEVFERQAAAFCSNWWEEWHQHKVRRWRSSGANKGLNFPSVWGPPSAARLEIWTTNC